MSKSIGLQIRSVDQRLGICALVGTIVIVKAWDFPQKGMDSHQSVNRDL